MTPDALFVFGLLAVIVVLFASDRLRPDLVALLVIVALILGDILPVSVAVAGFGDPLIILIAGLFVVGGGLVRTGIAFQVGQGLGPGWRQRKSAVGAADAGGGWIGRVHEFHRRVLAPDAAAEILECVSFRFVSFCRNSGWNWTLP